MPDLAQSIQAALSERFGERLDVDALPGLDELARIAAHRVQRRYLAREVAPGLLRLLCACALSAPSKSDLQQGDILIIREKAKRQAIADLLPEMPWLREAPVFLVFLANGRRLPRIAQMRGKPFPNDHLDLFFNATVDAAIVLATFLRAAEAVGLGCCPISVIRDHAARHQRDARAAGQGHSDRRHVRRLAGGGGRHHAAAAARHSRCTRSVSTRAISPVRSRVTTAAAPPSRPIAISASPNASAARNSTAGRRTRRGNMPSPLRADFGAFVRAKGFHLD